MMEGQIELLDYLAENSYESLVPALAKGLINKKDKIAQIYKCGNNHEKILYECSVREVVERLMQEYDGKRQVGIWRGDETNEK